MVQPKAGLGLTGLGGLVDFSVQWVICQRESQALFTHFSLATVLRPICLANGFQR